jgi:hypothetical protein
VVVWANGTGMPTEAYDHFLRHLASRGFLVVSSGDTQTGDGTTAVDVANHVISETKKPTSPWRAPVDTSRIGVAGHSQGGGAVMGLLARQTPPFSAYVAVHPAPSFFCYATCNYKPGDLAGAKKGAILFLQSAGDGGAGDTENYYNQTPDSATKAFGVVAHAKHDDVMGAPHCTGPNLHHRLVCLSRLQRGVVRLAPRWQLTAAPGLPQRQRRVRPARSRLEAHPKQHSIAARLGRWKKTVGTLLRSAAQQLAAPRSGVCLDDPTVSLPTTGPASRTAGSTSAPRLPSACLRSGVGGRGQPTWLR